MSKKKCSPSKILNPRTNRCVKKTGSIGRKIVGETKKCPPSKILNPRTNRCVKRKGSIGKNITSGVQSPSHRSSSSLSVIQEQIQRSYPKTDSINQSISKKYGQKIFDVIAENLQISPQDITFHRQIGKGSFGLVYEVELRGLRVIMKIERYYSSRRTLKSLSKIKDEIETQNIFFKCNTGTPEPLGLIEYSYKNSKYAIMIMRLDTFSLEFGMLRQILKKKLPQQELTDIIAMLEYLVQQFCIHNLIHGDFHFDNIGLQHISETDVGNVRVPLFIGNRQYILKPLIIDFGFAETNTPCSPEMEIVQLIRTLYPQFYKRNEVIHIYNRNILYTGFIHMLNQYPLGRDIVSYFPEKPKWTVSELDEIVEPLFTYLRRFRK